MENNPSSSRSLDRKFIERNRRNQMKALFRKLHSLVPHQRSKEATLLPDQLEEATDYIKKLQMNVEKMKEKKNMLLGRSVGLKCPRIEIQQMGSALEVVLITGLDSQFMFSETIRVLHEEGVDVVNATYKVIQDAVFHSIHCQDKENAHGAARISERLKNFI